MPMSEIFGFDAYSSKEIAGNLVGGSVLVALVYHIIYRRSGQLR